jgi:hypothetical protein
MKEQLKAVDIVVVPPDSIQDVAIDLSKKVLGSTFVLGKTEYVPHISLYMGYADDIEKIGEQVTESLKGELPFDLVAGGINTGGSIVNLGRNQDLRRLHYKLLNTVELVNDRRDAQAYVGGIASDETLNYISSFRRTHAKSSYFPHITLGDGVLPDEPVTVKLPIGFVAKKVAIFHLGNYNTCRILLKKWELDV